MTVIILLSYSDAETVSDVSDLKINSTVFLTNSIQKKSTKSSFLRLSLICKKLESGENISPAICLLVDITKVLHRIISH